MDRLADTNVLVRSIERNHPDHQDAVNALERLLRAGDALYITPQNVVEFWNVCTRPIDNTYGIKSILTFNRDDFTRYPGLEILTPKEVFR